MSEPLWMKTLDTPALVVDVPKMKENIREYHEWVAKNCAGAVVRPHTKTHKIPAIAKMQIEMGAKGIIVAKISEAEVMADAGIDDIFVCYPIIGYEKLVRLSKLNRKVKNLLVEVESIEGARQMSEFAQMTGETFNVVCEFDAVGYHRTGFPAETAADQITEVSKMPGLNVMGIFAYAYTNMPGGNYGTPEEAGKCEGQITVALANELRSRGVNITMVAGGSTPTGRWVGTVPGITEVHPGTYVYYDAMSKFFGITEKECAATVVCTVVACDETRACIDGGSKTFSTDLPTDCAPLFLEGYGKIIGHDDLRLDHFSEEHGIITSKNGGKVDLPIGSKVAIIPNHICPCVALHEYAYFVDGDSIEKVKIEGRGAIT